MTRSLTLLGCVFLATGCAATAESLPAFGDPVEIAAHAGRLKPGQGLVFQRREIRGSVDTRAQAQRAQSQMTFRVLISRTRPEEVKRPRMIGVQVQEEVKPPETLPSSFHLLVPAAGSSLTANARLIAPDGVPAPSAVTITPVPEDRAPLPSVDPGQQMFRIEGPGLRIGDTLEVVARSAIRGTLTLDGQWLGASEGPTGEFILRYDLPDHARAGLQVAGYPGRPMRAEQDGKTVFAFRATNVPAWIPGSGHTRFAMRSASPRGFDQRWARSWRDVAAPAVKALAGQNPSLIGNIAPPATPGEAGEPAWLGPWRWTRDRPQRPDAADTHWSEGRPLRGPLTANDLHGTDKAHLLFWLLREAGVRANFAVARGHGHGPISEDFPAAGCFQAALLHLPDADLFLDPVCRSCEAGEVRPELRGGQALILEKVQAPPVALPSGP